MKFENIKELISLIDQSSLTEFEYKQSEVSLRLSKNDNPSFRSASAPVEASVGQTVSMPVTAPAAVAEEVMETVRELEGKVITSPIVGVVYLQPNPESAAYVTEGEQITEGQVLCLVEAMKIMNEIKAEYAGQIIEILVENEQVVEYNQPLFRIV